MSETTYQPWPWDSPPRALTAALAKQLAAQLRPGPLYLLVDPYFGDPPELEAADLPAGDRPGVIRGARETAWKRPVSTLHTRDFPSSTERNFPYLVRLEGVDDDWFGASIEWAVQEHLKACAIGKGTYRMGGWLQAHGANDVHAPPRFSPRLDEDGVGLAHQIANIVQYTNGRGEPKMVRLCDRRVFHTLRQGTRIDWKEALRGIARWCYLDYNLALQTVQGASGLPALTPLIEGDAHEELLSRCGAVHLALTRWLRSTFPLPEDAFHAVLSKLEVAESRRLAYPEDRGAYAAEALTEPAFEHWPKLDVLINAILETRQELSVALDIYRPQWAGKATDHWITGRHT